MGVAYARARLKRGCGGAWGAHARGAAEHPALRERHRRKRLGPRPFDENSTLGWLNKLESSNAPKFVFSAGARAHAPLFPVANIFAGQRASLYALPRPSLVYSIGSKYAGLTLASSNRGTPAYPRHDILLLTNAQPLLQPGPEAQDAAAGVRATPAAPATSAGCEPTIAHLASALSAQSPPHAPA